jgi:mono/diheme cytochrome c family protein
VPRSRSSPWVAALAAAAFAALFTSQAASGADPARGRGLYEERCGGCHAVSVHGRDKRVARDYDAVRGWVRRWNETLMLRWSDADIEDVTTWLNTTYYGYPCPPTACKVLSMAGPFR